MRCPELHWHQEILDPRIRENLDHASEDSEDLLVEVATSYGEGYAGETPESVAKNIGNIITNRPGARDFRTPVRDDTDGREGEMLALGYVGVKAIKLAGLDDRD